MRVQPPLVYYRYGVSELARGLCEALSDDVTVFSRAQSRFIQLGYITLQQHGVTLSMEGEG